jgi:hypothetical protein
MRKTGNLEEFSDVSATMFAWTLHSFCHFRKVCRSKKKWSMRCIIKFDHRKPVTENRNNIVSGFRTILVLYREKTPSYWRYAIEDIRAFWKLSEEIALSVLNYSPILRGPVSHLLLIQCYYRRKPKLTLFILIGISVLNCSS